MQHEVNKLQLNRREQPRAALFLYVNCCQKGEVRPASSEGDTLLV